MNNHFIERKINKNRKVDKSAVSRTAQSQYENDPDLLNDVAIDLPRDGQPSGKSRVSAAAMSGKKTGEQPTQLVRSRGRPMKPHETEPFLSIDNLPPDKTFVSERTTVVTTRPSTNHAPLRHKSSAYRTPRQRTFVSPRAQASPEPPGSSTGSRLGSGSPFKSPFPLNFISRPTTGTKSGSRSRSGSRPNSRKTPRFRFGSRRSADSRHGRDPPANTPYMSPTKQVKVQNHHVRSPFKHAVGKSPFIPDERLTPSQDMKERTAFALYQINRAITMSGEMEPAKPPGKLQKGRLKPLYPVKIGGPGIALCRGIISDTKSYEASPSRTLQRRIHLMNTIPNVQDYLYEHRPRTVESVHQTSAASSLCDVRDDDDEALDSRSLPDEVLYTTPKPHSAQKPHSGLVTPNEPVINAVGTTGGQQQTEDRTPRMYATEPGSRDTDVTKTDVTISNHFQQELYICESNNANVQRNNNGTRLYIYNDDDVADNQKNRTVSPSKSVRFVEGGSRSESNIKEAKDMTNSLIASQQNERIDSAGEENNFNIEITIEERKTENENIQNQTKSEKLALKKKKTDKKSCKSDDFIFKKDEDNDDDNNKNDKHKGAPNNNQNVETGNRNSAGNKGNNSNDSNSGNKNTDKKGQKHSSRSQVQYRSRSASLSRIRSRTYNPGANVKTRSQTPTRLSLPQTPTKASPCLKFGHSAASKPHTKTTGIQTMVHSDRARNTLCLESPTQNRSSEMGNSASVENDKCKAIQLDDNVLLFGHEQTDYDMDVGTHQPKVSFLPEEDSSSVLETIFIEDESHVDIDPDKPLTFEAIETELENLRMTIQNKLLNGAAELSANLSETEYGQDEQSTVASDTVTDVSKNNSNKQLDLTVRCHSLMKKSEDPDSIRGSYSDLLEGYRRRCMDRSESCGILSSMLTTRRTPTVTSSVRNSQAGLMVNKNDDVEDRNHSAIRRHSIDSGNTNSEFKTQIIFSSQASDSGHGGSLENLSEMSRSASVAVSDVPPLDLEDNTSDLGLDGGHKEENVDNRNLLDIVCDQLSQQELQMEQPKLTKKETEADVSKLKVVATTKSLSKPKHEKLTMSTGSKAPFPPLCFTINARPPTGYLYYFAYGPEMNPNRFSSYIQREITDRYWALLFGFSLVFNKKGASSEAGGFANLEFNPLRSAEGVMYKITPQELEILDKCVGYPQHYEHLVLPVWMSNSVDPDNYGVAQYCVPALTYIAQNAWTETETPLSCEYSLSQCIKSADMLTTEYRQSLENMAATPQPVAV